MTAASPDARAARRSGTLRVGGAWLLAMLLFGTGAPAGADQIIGGGAVVSLDNGWVDLSCTDLVVAGTLNLNQGTYVNVHDVIIPAGGALYGGSGAITFSGKVTTMPGGLYVRQSAHVHRNPMCLGVFYDGDEMPIPTLGNSALIALAALMLWLAGLFLGEGGYDDIGAKKKGQRK